MRRYCDICLYVCLSVCHIHFVHSIMEQSRKFIFFRGSYPYTSEWCIHTSKAEVIGNENVKIVFFLEHIFVKSGSNCVKHKEIKMSGDPLYTYFEYTSPAKMLRLRYLSAHLSVHLVLPTVSKQESYRNFEFSVYVTPTRVNRGANLGSNSQRSRSQGTKTYKPFFAHVFVKSGSIYVKPYQNDQRPILHYPFKAYCCHMGTAIKHPVPGRVKPSFVFLTSGLSVRVPGCQKLQTTA